jgi:hypothetical protein
MTELLRCDNCRDEIEPGDEPIRRGDKVYCCEACAFEAGRSTDCGGRTDSHAQPIVEKT